MVYDAEDHPVPLPQVGVRGPGPSLLADLYSIERDIAFAVDCAQEYVAHAQRVEADEEPQEAGPTPKALWNAAAIAYRRSFNSGRGHLMDRKSRLRLADVIHQILMPDQLTVHEEALQMASQHIAHRVSDHEGAVVTVFLAPHDQERAIVGIGSLGVHMIGPPAEFALRFVEVCESVRVVLRAEIDRRGAQLLESLCESADLNALYQDAIVGGLGSAVAAD